MGNNKEVAIKFTLNENCTDKLTKIAKHFGMTEAAAKKSTKSFNQSVKNLNKYTKNFQDNVSKLAKIGAILGVSSAAVFTFGKNCAIAASDMQETMSKVSETFKTNTKDVTEWSKTSIKKMGLAQQTAMDTAALFGDMGVGMGLTTQKSAEMAMSLTQLSADLASFKNISQERAKTALNGVYTGETEALKSLGVVMTQANLEEFAHSKGIKKKIKDMKETEKVMLRYQYVLARTTNAQGDFERTGGGFANQQRMFEEMQKELSTKLGQAFLPKLTESLTIINNLLKQEMPNIIRAITPVFQGFANTIAFCTKHINAIITAAKIFIPLIVGFQIVQTAASGIMVLSQAFAILNGVLKMVNITSKALLIGFGWVAVIGAIVGVVILLWKNWDKVIAALKKAFEWFKKLFAMSPAGMLINGVKKAAGAIQNNGVKKHASGTAYSQGGMALVGERGPELVNLPQGARVNTASDTQKALGSNIVLNVNIGGNLWGTQQFLNEMKQQLGRELAVAMARG